MDQKGVCCDQPPSNREASEGSFDLWDIAAILPGNILLADGVLYRYSNDSLTSVILNLMRLGPAVVPNHDLGGLLYRLANLTDLSSWRCQLPSSVQLIVKQLMPEPRFYLKTSAQTLQSGHQLKVKGVVAFNYLNRDYPATCHLPKEQIRSEKQVLKFEQNGVGRLESEPTSIDSIPPPATTSVTLFYRNKKAEQARLRELEQHPDVTFNNKSQQFNVKQSHLLPHLYELLGNGWVLWAENLKMTLLEQFCIHLTDHIDWFEAQLEVPGAQQQSLSSWQLIMMLKRKSLFVILDDGSVGLLPEKWYQQLLELSEWGRVSDDEWRVPHAAAVRFDGMGEGEGDENEAHVRRDAAFSAYCESLKAFEGIQPQSAPATFNATLRPYQSFGVGWLLFLREMRLGGCLADDMGLGKTVQVLAYLATIKPSQAVLVVSPRSVIDHWRSEAQRLAPNLRVACYDDHRNLPLTVICQQVDLLLTTYATVRIHIESFEQCEFDTVLLDEAQMIKNSRSQVSRAVKRLKARHRLALTGTPIENHAGELISLFNFLNPGLVSETLHLPDLEIAEERVRAFIQSIKPLILRRLKTVLTDELPEKIVQEVRLPLLPAQQALYDEVYAYYAEKLKREQQAGGLEQMGEVRFSFLEGLLRLRQICCDAKLVDSALCDEADESTSAKLNFLLEKASTVIETGSKALIFSQFTTFLQRVRDTFDQEGIQYAYLDGASQDRADIVDRFKQDPNTHFFLISLKAGGFGLNLTEADYAFLLDPWWNRAVEEQAINRIHRIGQHNAVCIYKLVSEQTIEEKVLQLQASKVEQAELLDELDMSYLERLSLSDLMGLFS